jgi:hypothetical protein
VANIVGSLGVAKVANDIIKQNTVVNTTFDAIRVWSGSIVIGSIVADVASTHVNEKLDSAAAWLESRQGAAAKEKAQRMAEEAKRMAGDASSKVQEKVEDFRSDPSKDDYQNRSFDA